MAENHIYAGNICEGIGIIKLHDHAKTQFRAPVTSSFLHWKQIFCSHLQPRRLDKIYGPEIVLYCYYQQGVMFYLFFQKCIVYFFRPPGGTRPHNAERHACAMWHVSCRPSGLKDATKKNNMEYSICPHKGLTSTKAKYKCILYSPTTIKLNQLAWNLLVDVWHLKWQKDVTDNRTSFLTKRYFFCEWHIMRIQYQHWEGAPIIKTDLKWSPTLSSLTSQLFSVKLGLSNTKTTIS